MTIDEALNEFGVRDNLLTVEQKEQLNLVGYVILESLLSPEEVEQYRQVLARIMAEEGENAGKEQHQEAGTDRIADLVNKDPLFDRCYIHPQVLAGAVHVIGRDIKLFCFSTRSALPGQGAQGLHKDGYHQPEKAGEYHLCNTIWLLDDFTPQNGATRLIPGSHLTPGVPEEVVADPMAQHPEEIKVAAPAGSVVIFNSHMLHGGTQNFTGKPRRAMFLTYCRSDQQQLTNQREYLRPETASRISQAAKVLLDVA